MCTWLYTYYQKVRKLWKWRAEILTTTSHTATFRCPPDLRIRWARKSLASEQLEGSSSEGRPSESQCCRIQYNSYLCCQIYTQYNPCPRCFETLLRFYLKSIISPFLQFKVLHPKKSICWRLFFESGICKAHIYESNISQSTWNI